MTVLADHASPYRAHTLPRRAPLRWRRAGCHYLLGDTTGQPALAAFTATGSGVSQRDLSALPDAQQQAILAQICAQDHLLVIGCEGFLQRAHALAWQLAIDQDRLQCQRVGPDRRDVLCLQCRTICRAVATRIHACSCGTVLLVRDHFSARKGLYQGAPLAPDDALVTALGSALLDSCS